MRIIRTIGDNGIEAQDEKGRLRMYTGLLKKDQRRVMSFHAKGFHGRAWNLLKKHTCHKQETS